VGKREFNNIEDFLTDDGFICFVFEQTFSLKEYWNDYFKLNPNKMSLAKEAKHILLNEVDVPGISSIEKEELKGKILSTIKKAEIK